MSHPAEDLRNSLLAVEPGTASSAIADTVQRRLSPAAVLAPPRRDPSAPAQHKVLPSFPDWRLDVAVLAGAVVVVAATAPQARLAEAIWTSLFCLSFLSFAYGRALYRPRLVPRLLDATRVIGVATVEAAAIVIAARVIITGTASAAGDALRTWVFVTVALVVLRVCVTVARRATRDSGAPTLIIGAGQTGRAVAARLRARPELGLRPVGFLDKEPLLSDYDGDWPELPVLGASWDLDDVVTTHGIRQVIVAFSTAPTDVLLRVLNRCEQLGVRTCFVPRLFEKTTEQLTVDHLGGVPLMWSYAPDPRGWQFALKYALDRIVAGLAIVVFAPLLGVLALAVLLSSGRPVLYRQERVGRDGKLFDMLKFRSMRPAAATDDLVVALRPGAAPGGVEGADRRTPVGTFLRRTSLDELPQLFNVLKGDMSFVGPRPERPEFVDMFERSVRRYGDRHRVKSGITGWSQVNGLRGKTSVSDRAEWDNYYIENWSFWFDFKILLLTIVAVFDAAE